jgi:hypothetical protein
MDGADLKAICSSIGRELRKLFADVLGDPIPDEMADLLRQLESANYKAISVHDDDAPRQKLS